MFNWNAERRTGLGKKYNLNNVYIPPFLLPQFEVDLVLAFLEENQNFVDLIMGGGGGLELSSS